MTGALPRVVAPAFETRCGRTWLTYPEFNGSLDSASGDITSSMLRGPGLVHGVAVFRDASFDVDRHQWLERAKAVVEEGVAQDGEGVHPERIVVPWQIHSAKVCDADALVDGDSRADGEVCELGSKPGREDEVGCDGVVTAKPRVMVGVTIADCVPLLAVNDRARVVGAAHCGWRGTASGIVGEFVKALGALVDDEAATRYLIGPSIGPCCYEVGDDMLSHFSGREREACVTRRAGGTGRSGETGGSSRSGGGGNGRSFFDLKAVVATRLMVQGVSPGQICVDNTCTSCQQYRLSSYRAGGRDCGRMLAFVMLTK